MDIKKQTKEELLNELKNVFMAIYESTLNQICALMGHEKEFPKTFANLEEQINLEAKFLIACLYGNYELKSELEKELERCTLEAEEIFKEERESFILKE